jgi:hypothetical protein
MTEARVEKCCASCLKREKGRFSIVKSAESKRASLLANLGDFNRPLRVRPVRYMGREWWAIDAEETWPGMVMDLRRLGFESVALGEEVLVREPTSSYEPLMDGPAVPNGLRPFPTLHPTIQVRKDSYLSKYANLNEYGDYNDDFENEFEFEEDLDEEE